LGAFFPEIVFIFCGFFPITEVCIPNLWATFYRGKRRVLI
jgi:hypothetical protein